MKHLLKQSMTELVDRLNHVIAYLEADRGSEALSALYPATDLAYELIEPTFTRLLEINYGGPLDMYLAWKQGELHDSEYTDYLGVDESEFAKHQERMEKLLDRVKITLTIKSKIMGVK